MRPLRRRRGGAISDAAGGEGGHASGLGGWGMLLALALAAAIRAAAPRPPPRRRPSASSASNAAPSPRSVRVHRRVEAIDKVEIRARAPPASSMPAFARKGPVKANDPLFTIEQPPFRRAGGAARGAGGTCPGRAANATNQVARGRDPRSVPTTFPRPASTTGDRSRAAARPMWSVAQAELQQARIQYGDTEIRAPFDGRLGAPPLTPGNVVGPDTGVLVTLVRDDPIRVTFPRHPARPALLPPRRPVRRRVPRPRPPAGRHDDGFDGQAGIHRCHRQPLHRFRAGAGGGAEPGPSADRRPGGDRGDRAGRAGREHRHPAIGMQIDQQAASCW